MQYQVALYKETPIIVTMSDRKSFFGAANMDPEDPGHLLRQFMMAIRTQASEAVSPLGYTMPQFGALMMLKMHPGSSNADMARMMSVTPQALGEVMSGLEKAKLVRRKPHDKNARILVASLTSAGEKALSSCKEALDGMNARMFSHLTPENKKQFGSLLQLCLKGLGADMPRAKLCK